VHSSAGTGFGIQDVKHRFNRCSFRFEILVLGGTENQDRNARGGTKDSFERLDTASVIQGQVEEYGVDSTQRLWPGDNACRTSLAGRLHREC
jgi:hypothetical protein